VDNEGNVITDSRGGYFDSQGNPVNAFGDPLDLDSEGNVIYPNEPVRKSGICIECEKIKAEKDALKDEIEEKFKESED